jgi:hypothetical protein
LASIAGQTVDQKPMIIWSHEEMYSDVAVVQPGRAMHSGAKSRIVLAEVLSPFSRAIAKRIKLSQMLCEEPKKGEEVLTGLIQQTKSEMESAHKAGADGVFYRLQGAEPAHSSPMEYGGHYLEVDREILTPANGEINLVYIEGGPETYIDFVSDLPGSIFAWDCERTGIPVSALRRLRQGALATSDQQADILFGSNYGILHQLAAEEVATSNV